MRIDAIAKNKILVVGDIILDEYLGGIINRISPEAPVPVVHVKETSYKLGGAANVASNLKSLGCEVILLGVVGNDEMGDKIAKLLDNEGIEAMLVKSVDKPTIRKTRVIGRSSHMLRLDYEEHYDKCDSDELSKKFNDIISQVDSCIFSDYAKGTLQNIRGLISVAKQENKIVFVDPKHVDFAVYAGSDFITPNGKEMAAMLPVKYDSPKWLSSLQEKMQHNNIANVLYTRGKDGMSLITADGDVASVSAIASEVFDVTGAGDTVIATFAALITAGFEYDKAMTIANYAAGFVVRRQGTAKVKITDLMQLLRENLASESMVEDIIADIRAAKAAGCKIVMTNGCFDILHAGHVRYLEQARMQGDKLIVAINSDESVRELKGPSRPINKIENRVTVLQALACVDWVVVFNEQTPINIITDISPDILVKGSDYKVSEIVGADHVLSYGGTVGTIDLVPDLSTSNVVKKITNSSKESEEV